MSIPAFDPRAQNAPLLDEIASAIRDVLETGRFIGGPHVEGLESELAAYVGAGDAVAVSSGTDALLVALMAAGIGPGDQVLTTPFTFFATAGSVHRLGAGVLFCDVEPATLLLDPGRVASALGSQPGVRAILPVHLYGRVADLSAFEELARRHDLTLIEDAAQAIGAHEPDRRDRPAGSVGRYGCFSFYPTKNLGGIGDGGFVTCRDAEDAERLRSLRNHGMSDRYRHETVGGNFRLDAVQAAALRVKLRHVAAWNRERRRLATLYTGLFAEHGLDGRITLPPLADGDGQVFHQYVIRVPPGEKSRDRLRDHLADSRIGTAIYYPLALHEQPCFASLGYRNGDFPESERAAREVLALPLYPGLRDEHVAEVVAAIQAFFDSRSRSA